MAKGRNLPPKQDIGKVTKEIIAKGKQTQPKETLAKGQSKTHVEAVKKSRVPTPSQNQRGRVPTKGDNDLTR